MKFIVLLVAGLIQFGCQTAVHRETPAPTPPPPPALSPQAPKAEINRETITQVPGLPGPTPTPPLPENLPKATFEKAKVAIILGPGGLRAYAHAGVLQEISRAKINLVGIGGLEMGALPAALYAMKPQAFEAEWQMMKLKEDDFSDRGIIGGARAKDLNSWDSYLKSVFGSARFDEARIPFGCITLQLDRQQAMVVSKGVVDQTLPNCMAFPPLFKPIDRFVAGADQLSSLVQHFRQKGATHILYVDLLSDKSKTLSKTEEVSVIWSLVSASLQSQGAYVQDTLRISINGELNQFNQRRDFIQKGKDTANKSLTYILQKMGAF